MGWRHGPDLRGVFVLKASCANTAQLIRTNRSKSHTPLCSPAFDKSHSRSGFPNRYKEYAAHRLLTSDPIECQQRLRHSHFRAHLSEYRLPEYVPRHSTARCGLANSVAAHRPSSTSTPC